MQNCEVVAVLVLEYNCKHIYPAITLNILTSKSNMLILTNKSIATAMALTPGVTLAHPDAKQHPIPAHVAIEDGRPPYLSFPSSSVLAGSFKHWPLAPWLLCFSMAHPILDGSNQPATPEIGDEGKSRSIRSVLPVPGGGLTSLSFVDLPLSLCVFLSSRPQL